MRFWHLATGCKLVAETENPLKRIGNTYYRLVRSSALPIAGDEFIRRLRGIIISITPKLIPPLIDQILFNA